MIQPSPASKLFDVPNFMMIINRYSKDSGPAKLIDPLEQVIKAGIDFITSALEVNLADMLVLSQDNYIDAVSTFFNFLGCVTTPAVKGSC
jgi:hypothetical protein